MKDRLKSEQLIYGTNDVLTLQRPIDKLPVFKNYNIITLLLTFSQLVLLY